MPSVDHDDELREKLAAQQSRVRRWASAIWLALAAILLGGGIAGWRVAGRKDYLWAGILYSVSPLVGWAYTRYRLIPAGHVPITLDAELRQRNHDSAANAAKVAVTNGWIVLIGSIFITPVFIQRGAAEYGWSGAILGSAAGAFGVLGSLWSIRWGRRRQRV